jgi:hypothetical protein
LAVIQKLLGTFPPSSWSEELYSESPLYYLENVNGRISIVPTRPQTELILDNLSEPIGLKKRKQGHTYYVVSRSDSIKSFKQFEWFLRRSWRNKDYGVLWSLSYIAQAKGWDDRQRLNFSLASISELSGCDEEKCKEILIRLADATHVPTKLSALGDEYEVSKAKLDEAMENLVGELPSWSEEVIMGSLCSGTGGSIADVYENIAMLGLTIGAAYKIVERLKQQGYIYPSRHFRVNDKGPMREMLSANCRNCFYGFTREENCLLATFRQLKEVLKTYYGKELTSQESQSLYLSIKSIPYGSRVCRRALESLRLVHQVKRMTNEGKVLMMLKKIEEKCGIELPMKIVDLPVVDSTGPPKHLAEES